MRVHYTVVLPGDGCAEDSRVVGGASVALTGTLEVPSSGSEWRVGELAAAFPFEGAFHFRARYFPSAATAGAPADAAATTSAGAVPRYAWLDLPSTQRGGEGSIAALVAAAGGALARGGEADGEGEELVVQAVPLQPLQLAPPANSVALDPASHAAWCVQRAASTRAPPQSLERYPLAWGGGDSAATGALAASSPPAPAAATTSSWWGALTGSLTSSSTSAAAVPAAPPQPPATAAATSAAANTAPPSTAEAVPDGDGDWGASGSGSGGGGGSSAGGSPDRGAAPQTASSWWGTSGGDGGGAWWGTSGGSGGGGSGGGGGGGTAEEGPTTAAGGAVDRPFADDAPPPAPRASVAATAPGGGGLRGMLASTLKAATTHTTAAAAPAPAPAAAGGGGLAGMTKHVTAAAAALTAVVAGTPAPPLVVSNLEVQFTRITTPFDASLPEHAALLRRMWAAGAPAGTPFARPSPGWVALGFKSADPAADLRIAGALLGAYVLADFMEREGEAYRSLLDGVAAPAGGSERAAYPVALVAITMALRVAREALYLMPDAADGGGGGGGGGLGRTRTVYWDLFAGADAPDIVSDLAIAGTLVFDNVWHLTAATLAAGDFVRVLDAAFAKVRAWLDTAPPTRAALRTAMEADGIRLA